MDAKHNPDKISIIRREHLAVFVATADTFAWYALIYIFMIDIVGKLHVTSIETLVIFAFHYVGVASSAILNPFILKKIVNRNLFLLFWMFFGVCASALLLVLEISMPTSAFIIFLLLGFSIGIGLPSCLAYFADSIKIENRGKAGGIVWVAAGLGTLSFAVLFYASDTVTMILTLAILRAIGMLFFLLRHERKTPNLEIDTSYSSIIGDRHILLYLIPWIMFCLINWTETPIVENLFGEEFFRFITFIAFAVSGIFALIGGFFSDVVGRKRLIITGFIMLGIEYAVLSFLHEAMIGRYIYVFLDGITWGMFAVVFFIVLWGDLAENKMKEKYYVIGGLPYLLASFLQVLVKPYVKSIPVNTAFSLASFFLFLAVLPLMYASETLPEKKIKERELKGYIEKAKKVKEKYT